MSIAAAASVDDYIDAQPPARRDALHELRRVILAAVPDAVEAIRYGMPAYRFPNQRPICHSRSHTTASGRSHALSGGEMRRVSGPPRSA